MLILRAAFALVISYWTRWWQKTTEKDKATAILNFGIPFNQSSWYKTGLGCNKRDNGDQRGTHNIDQVELGMKKIRCFGIYFAARNTDDIWANSPWPQRRLVCKHCRHLSMPNSTGIQAQLPVFEMKHSVEWSYWHIKLHFAWSKWSQLGVWLYKVTSESRWNAPTSNAASLLCVLALPHR